MALGQEEGQESPPLCCAHSPMLAASSQVGPTPAVAAPSHPPKHSQELQCPRPTLTPNAPQEQGSCGSISDSPRPSPALTQQPVHHAPATRRNRDLQHPSWAQPVGTDLLPTITAPFPAHLPGQCQRGVMLGVGVLSSRVCLKHPSQGMGAM